MAPAEDVAHVDGAEVGEADQLPGGAVEVGAAVEHEHRLAAGGKERGDRGALDAVVEAEQHGGGGEGGAGVAGGEEGVGPPLLLQVEADHEARLGLLPDGRERLLAHADDVSRLVDLEAAAVDVGMWGELGLDDLGTADQLDHELVRQARERLQHPGDFGLRRLVAPHRVHGDANHAQASSTSICFLPR